MVIGLVPQLIVHNQILRYVTQSMTTSCAMTRKSIIKSRSVTDSAYSALWPIAHNQILRFGQQRGNRHRFLLYGFIPRSGPQRIAKSAAVAHRAELNLPQQPIAHDQICCSRPEPITKFATVAQSASPNSPQGPQHMTKFAAVAHSVERRRKFNISGNSNLYSKLLQITNQGASWELSAKSLETKKSHAPIPLTTKIVNLDTNHNHKEKVRCCIMQ